MDASKHGNIPIQRNVDLNKTQGPPHRLRDTKDMFLVYGGDSTTELSVTCYTDAGWETDEDYLRSQTRLGVVPNNDRPMDMYYDNTSAITIADEPGVQKGAKHFFTKISLHSRSYSRW
nr:hypothetical protein [Tanacetum cinerariifolium]